MVNKTVNRMRNGYIFDISVSIDIQEIGKIGGKVIEIYDGEIFQIFLKYYLR